MEVNMVKVYDRNRNQIIPGKRVMVAQTGEIDVAKAIHAEGLAPVQAEREPVVELQHTGERYVPFDLVRLG
ncbi:putative selenium delivery protein YdfZ [Yersinia enterocolitica]|nr:putative selenium delivery protein YdfZ [Yersinia enterocolitica]EKN5099124.1 putative selenium delivery protein YdfZ [Yersinia enterocolitica]EKN5104023.1 putative selenium delivery protein YdfZ [Yersinia enterocolitica]EKN5124463.1 putative selenium delivery protein YdfZ [Yersinia enterocolitica]EKN5129341.1 putative selenium delivery protein YdfZ [Yersinia enterocolitica]